MKIKNYLLLTALVIFASSMVQAGNFYVGAGAALINSTSTIKLNGTAHSNNYQGNRVLSDNTSAIAPRFFAGYEKDNNNCFIAGEVIGALNDINGKKDAGDLLGLDNTNNAQIVLPNVSIKYARNYTVGARIKFGGYITDEFSAFAALGVINSQFQIAYSDTDTTKNSFNKNLFGIEPGVGVSYKISRKWRLGLEYFYQQYGATNSRNLTSQANSSAILKTKFKFTTFCASVSYVL